MKKILFYSIAVSMLCFFDNAKGQSSKTDSLYRIAKSNKDDTNKVKALLSLGKLTGREVGNPDTAMVYFNRSLALARKINYKKGIATAFIHIGLIYSDRGDNSKALEYYHKSLEIREEMGDKRAVAACLNNIGIVYSDRGDVPKALEYYTRSLKIREELGDKNGIATTLNSIANVYADQGDLTKAQEYYDRALKLLDEMGDRSEMASIVNNIGALYFDQGDMSRALEYYNKSLKIREEIGDKEGVALSLMSIGNTYNQQRNFPPALEYYNRSLKLSEAIEYIQVTAANLNNMGSIYYELGELDKARDCALKSLAIGKEVGDVESIQIAAQGLYSIYKKQGKAKLALEYHELYIQMRDSLRNEANTKATLQQQMQYEFGKKAAADSVKVVEEKKVVAAQFKQERTQRYALYSGLALVGLFGAFMFNRFRVTQKQKNIIEIKERETQEQKHIIEEKHKEITDSINYAERIQRSFLATEQHLNENLPEYFVLFKPKDVVSGDFYWSATLPDATFVLVTADSTGHGVPGAIMSLLNITSLEKAIERHTRPAEILNATRKTIIERLKKDGSGEGGKDGMDCSLCVYDFTKMELHIAAANNPVWIVRFINGEAELIEAKPDKMPVGKHDRQDTPFTEHKINLQKGDVVYTLTDGFPDQFGGPNGKKFMIKKLRELLLANAQLPLHEQRSVLENSFSEWVGSLEQIDDVTVIGVRV